jgi:hypothetical protein
MAMEWIDNDFKKMHFNVWKNSAKNKNLLDVFPVFNDYLEFDVKLGKLNKNHVIRYICFMYDVGSPLPQKIENILKMKIESADLAGFKRDSNNEFSDEVNEFMVGGNNAVNHMIVRFLSLFHDISFLTYKVYKAKHYEVIAQLQTEKDPYKIEKLLKTSNLLVNDIASLSSKIFLPEDSNNLIQAMYEQAEFEASPITPEDIIERLEKGMGVVSNPPYGDFENEMFEREEE